MMKWLTRSLSPSSLLLFDHSIFRRRFHRCFVYGRELLAFGNKREAVEWAMRNRAESHALYLAMLMDAVSPGPTMGDVVARLEASLPANDPILTGTIWQD